jgi:hypothetical protein
VVVISSVALCEYWITLLLFFRSEPADFGLVKIGSGNLGYFQCEPLGSTIVLKGRVCYQEEISLEEHREVRSVEGVARTFRFRETYVGHQAVRLDLVLFLLVGVLR